MKTGVLQCQTCLPALIPNRHHDNNYAEVPEHVRKSPAKAQHRTEPFRAVPEMPVAALYTACSPCS
eukprot:15444254-Alexandrium_andersonii.AAC.1